MSMDGEGRSANRVVGALLIVWSACTLLPEFGLGPPQWLPDLVYVVLISGGPVAFGAGAWLLSGFSFPVTLSWTGPLFIVQTLAFVLTSSDSVARYLIIAGSTAIVAGMLVTRRFPAAWLNLVRQLTKGER